MQINEQVLQQVGLDVCESMLSLPQTLASKGEMPRGRLSASVEIRGEHCGSLEVIAGEELAVIIAEIMFASDRTTLNPSDIRDALGEVANMIGGNLKGILGGEADLSLPHVVPASTFADGHSPNAIRTSLDYCGMPMTLVFRQSA